MFWYTAQVDFGDLEAAKQITEVCGQMVMTLPLISKKSVVVPSTQLSKHKMMVRTFKGTQYRYLAQQADKVSRCDLR